MTQAQDQSRRAREALRVIRAEAEGLTHLADAMDRGSLSPSFSDAVSMVLRTSAYLIVVGVGKSGQIGQKLAASFASTGTPSFFMHPTEASHGDLGMVTEGCTVLALSNSGESHELIDVLHFCRKAGVPVIGMTRDPASTLGRASTVVLELPDSPEACANGLAPTTSTTNMLALGDALVLAAMSEKGVTRSDFGQRHPGGKLGRGLQSVGDWMALHSAPAPTAALDARIDDIIHAVSAGQAGCVAIVDKKGRFVGMITDGDLRRAMKPDIFDKRAQDIMTVDPMTLCEDQIMSEVIEAMSERKISNAFVLKDDKPVAILHMKALMSQGYI